MHRFQIYRYNQDTDAAPRMQEIELEVDGGDRMLLDALSKLKAIGKINKIRVRRVI